MLSEHLAHAGSAPLPSDRSFGLLFAVIFLVVGGWPYLKPLVECARHWQAIAETCVPALEVLTPNVSGLIASGLFLLTSLVHPKLLRPLNRLWMAFGHGLHIVVSALVLGILFFFVMTPFGLLMRLGRRDALALRRDPAAASYWISRNPPGPDPKTLSNQF